jgi:hypothetical protein
MQDMWHGQAEEWPRWRWTHLDSMEQEVMTPMTNKGKAMLKYMALPEPYNSYLSDDICEIEAEMLSLVPDVVSLNDAYQQGLRDARVAVEGTLGRDAMRLLDSVLDWYGNSKGRVVPELEYANRWRLANAADIDAILAALPAPRPRGCSFTVTPARRPPYSGRSTPRQSRPRPARRRPSTQHSLLPLTKSIVDNKKPRSVFSWDCRGSFISFSLFSHVVYLLPNPNQGRGRLGQQVGRLVYL